MQNSSLLFNYKYESISWRLLKDRNPITLEGLEGKKVFQKKEKVKKIAKDRKVIPDPIDDRKFQDRKV